MKIITIEATTSEEGVLRESSGLINTVLDEPKPGFMRLLGLGSQGLFIKHGPRTVAIPLAELLKAAEQADPEFIPPA